MKWSKRDITNQGIHISAVRNLPSFPLVSCKCDALGILKLSPETLSWPSFPRMLQPTLVRPPQHVALGRTPEHCLFICCSYYGSLTSQGAIFFFPLQSAFDLGASRHCAYKLTQAFTGWSQVFDGSAGVPQGHGLLRAAETGR